MVWNRPKALATPGWSGVPNTHAQAAGNAASGNASTKKRPITKGVGQYTTAAVLRLLYIIQAGPGAKACCR